MWLIAVMIQVLGRVDRVRWLSRSFAVPGVARPARPQPGCAPLRIVWATRPGGPADERADERLAVTRGTWRQAARWSTRRRRRSTFARPYIWRFTSFSRVTCPAVWPLDQGSVSAATSAASSCRRLAAQDANSVRPLASARASQRPQRHQVARAEQPPELPRQVGRQAQRCRVGQESVQVGLLAGGAPVWRPEEPPAHLPRGWWARRGHPGAAAPPTPRAARGRPPGPAIAAHRTGRAGEAARPQLAPQLGGVIAAGGPALAQVGLVPAQRRQVRAPGAAHGATGGAQVLPHRDAGQPDPPTDRAQRQPLPVQRMHLLI